MPTIENDAQRDELLRILHPTKGLEYWFRNYYITLDKPNNRMAAWPAHPYLIDYIYQLDYCRTNPGIDQDNIEVEKSRDMLITLTTAGYMTYCVQYVPNWSGFVTSRRENEVDDGGEQSTEDSIFGMVRRAWLNQPAWLRVPMKFSYLKIRNLEPRMSSYMTGESANPNAGRGKSVSFKYGDEFAFIPQSDKVHKSMSGGNYGTLCYSSTANFTGNKFHDIRKIAADRKDKGLPLREGDFRLLRYHYSMIPGRNAEWAKKMRRSKGDLEWLSEYEIQYEFSTERSVWPKYDSRIHAVPESKLRVDGDPYITFDDGFATPGAMYFALGGPNGISIYDEVYEAGIQVRVSDDQRQDGVKDWITVAKGMLAKRGYEPEDCTVVLGQESSAAAGYSNTGALFKLEGFKVHVADKKKLERIRTIDRLMIHSPGHNPLLLISDECFNLLREIPRYERRMKDGRVTEIPRDGRDHGCDAIGGLAQYVFPDILEEPAESWVSDFDSWTPAGVLGGT